jgi:hypothetical protein
MELLPNITRLIRSRRMRINGACSTLESDEKCKQNVGLEAVGEDKSCMENLSTGEMIIL